jgi:hypothetical protein
MHMQKKLEAEEEMLHAHRSRSLSQSWSLRALDFWRQVLVPAALLRCQRVGVHGRWRWSGGALVWAPVGVMGGGVAWEGEGG